MKEETNSNEKSKKLSIGEHKGKPTIVDSGFLNFTQPPSDDEWGDEFIDGVDHIPSKDSDTTTIED